MMASKPEKHTSARGRRIALFLAAVGVFWMLVVELGKEYEWSQSTRLLFDLFALAGFGWGVWMAIDLWRSRRGDEG